MIYAKVDVELRDHPKALAAGNAMATWTWGLLYVRSKETDGFIPKAALRGAWVGSAEALKHAATLVQVSLWEAVDGGWRICKYELKNDTKAAIAENKARVRERVTAHRDRVRNALQTPAAAAFVPGSGSYSGSNSDQEIKIPEEIPPRAREPEATPSMARYQEAYANGVRRGKAGPWSWPGTKYADWDLGKIIKDHCKDSKGVPYKGDQLLRCIEHNAAEFASDVLERKIAQYYSAFEPRGCLKWLNEAAMLEEARRVG